MWKTWGCSKIVVKENSGLKVRHLHKWGKEDAVSSSLGVFLGKGAKLSYTYKCSYKCLEVPEKLEMENNAPLNSYSSANFEVAFLAKGGDVDIRDSTFLNGEKSSGMMRLRTVADEGSRVSAHSKMVANGAGRGHLDCMGLLLAEDSSINAVPELLNKNMNATLTHEASIGKISEEELNYLRSRGLTEDAAINLIITGFLDEEEPFTYKGRILPSKIYM